MAVSVQIEVEGAEAILRIIKKLPETTFNASKIAFSKAALAAHDQVLGKMRGVGTLRRSGTLARSIRPATLGKTTAGKSLKDLTATLDSDVVYARIQEQGGTINAKSAYRNVPGGPYLNIPTRENQTAAGVTRQTAKQVFQQGKGRIIRSDAGVWIVLGKAPTKALSRSSGKKGARGFVPMFILKKSVTIKGTLGMEKAANDQVPKLLARLNSQLPSFWGG